MKWKLILLLGLLLLLLLHTHTHTQLTINDHTMFLQSRIYQHGQSKRIWCALFGNISCTYRASRWGRMSGLGALLKGGSVVLTPLDVGMSPLLRVAATAGGCRCCSNQGGGLYAWLYIICIYSTWNIWLITLVPIIKSRKARSVRFQRNETLRHNRRDPALERAARKGTRTWGRE